MNAAVEAAAAKPRFESSSFFVSERREQMPRGPHERILVVSDLHGAKDEAGKPLEVISRLKAIPLTGEHRPTAVILAGDVAGNPDLGRLQKLFYNHLTNHTRSYLDQNPPSPMLDDGYINDLLSYSGNNPTDKEYADYPNQQYNVKTGFLKLRAKELSLEGLSEAEIIGILDGMTDRDIAADVIRYHKSYKHYGHYASDLPEAAVAGLARGLQENAQQLAEPLKRLRDAGVRVIINEGNWDPSPPIAFRRGTTDPQRLSADEQNETTGFSTQKFFEQEGIEYVTSTHVVETDTAALVLIPFDQLVRYSGMDIATIREDEKQKLAAINKAREEGKQVIVIQHGEVMWEPHNLTDPQSEPKGEHAQVIAGSNKINGLVRPNETIYGHFHGLLEDEEGVKLPIDTKYIVKYAEEPEVVFDNTPVVISPKDLTKDAAERATGVSYMPLQRIATILIPRDNDAGQRIIKGFGGEREFAEVT